MPISAEKMKLYPGGSINSKEWKDIRNNILERANNCCEECGVENYSMVERKCKRVKIVLTIAHLDHNPTNSASENLRAWCQKCHLTYDAKHHAANAAETRRKRKAIRDLFETKLETTP